MYKKNRYIEFFLRLIRYLKIVFFQNSVLFQQKYLDYPNFKYPLFKTPEYAEFAAKIKEIITLNP
jgi:hypothetical protein